MPQYLPFAPNLYGPAEAQLVSFMCGGKIRESIGDLSNLSTVLMTDLLLTSIHWLPQAWQVPGREREGGRKKWREEGEEEVNICDLQSCPKFSFAISEVFMWPPSDQMALLYAFTWCLSFLSCFLYLNVLLRVLLFFFFYLYNFIFCFYPPSSSFITFTL